MDDQKWIQLAVDSCTHAGIRYRTIETIATWDQKYCANAVYRIDGGLYLKVFGPTATRQFHVERSVLQTLEAYPEIPTPQILAEGEPSLHSPYLILTEVPGSTAEIVWDGLSRPEQLTIAQELGFITAAIHRLPQHDLLAVEQQFGGRQEHIKREQARRIRDIEATQTVSLSHRNDMINFLRGEAGRHLNETPKLTHCELAHNHLYLSRETGKWQVTGFIDWADAMIGPPEWDVTFLWFWTFSRDQVAMQHCLQTLYAESPPPDRFAQRCLAAILHTHSGPALWEEFTQRGVKTESIRQEITEYFFPPEVFGSSD